MIANTVVIVVAVVVAVGFYYLEDLFPSYLNDNLLD